MKRDPGSYDRWLDEQHAERCARENETTRLARIAAERLLYPYFEITNRQQRVALAAHAVRMGWDR